MATAVTYDLPDVEAADFLEFFLKIAAANSITYTRTALQFVITWPDTDGVQVNFQRMLYKINSMVLEEYAVPEPGP